ncbi:phage tail protein [Lactiplantibacillus plantarum]|uniref:phage tail protein n=1 Tax=Lactiplantibacillus plantarum TaxID=1590 RepID=UPI00203E3A2B|nr:phage tail protein [Lactiplantibacillus plantarum]MCM2585121.1 phage tail protein [Lactiplantibacillus plantarum]MCM2599046.1 phage tail protein [Lactiplantibacillus plantarum]MCM2602208.1 phage tail protein [Lactiplantibacillus plantarum]MCM2609547.1 phage tail protein [Lactiplantibacillus plantarum]MCM2611362.1 phage tail protein [Lactiplantibacillus plantarum]
MAESNATQVILTDDGMKIIKAQNTADNAASGITNLNDPNLMSVIEKQTQASQYAGLTSQYNVILKRAKEANISTTALTAAYANLNTFMAAILTDTTKASDVDRDTYKSLTDAYNTAISNVQTALNNSFNTDIDNMQSSVSVASQAASQAIVVASQAKSAGNNAISVANNASQAASNAILAGSTATVSANKASADYQTLSAGVKDGSVVHITTETVIDKGVIGTAEIANGAITNAQIGSEAVGMAQIADLAVGTAQIGDGAITNAKIGKLAVGTAQIANAAITDAKIGNINANHLTAGTIDFNTVTGKNINASNIATGTMSTDRLNVNKLSALSANLGDVTTGSLKGVDIVANTFSTPNGSFTTDKNGNVVASNLTIRGVTNLVYNAALLGGNGLYIPGWNMNGEGYYSNAVLFDGVPAITWNGDATGRWDIYATSKLQPVTQTGIPYSASIKFRDYGSASGMQYLFTIAFFSANDTNARVNSIDHWYTANGSDSGIQTFTVNNAIAPSTAKYVAIQIQAHNGKGHVAFSSAMLTQTAQSTGYQPDTGNVVSAGEIDGSVINGSTINGTTFHGGDSISDSNNTSNFYPFTIEPTGKASTTLFNSMGALRTEMSGGGLRTMYRAINSSGSQYEAYDGNFSGDMISLNSGFTNGKDMSFSQSVSGSQLTGQVLISPLNGLTLHGDTQQITFNGTSADVTPKGIIITPYGNINPNGTQNIWYVGNGPTMKTASFGIDGSGANNIQFNRSLDIGNFNINTYHTITSSDNGPIHFNRANGSSVDIFAATVNYTSLVKSSLLSVKKDVKKADTAYWAQLVNSIDLATYQYKTDDNTSHLRLSSIVDDVNVTKQWQLPDVFISRDENGKLSGVDDSVLLNATLATVQEQQKQINQLNGHNMELEARLNKLEAKLNG